MFRGYGSSSGHKHGEKFLSDSHLLAPAVLEIKVVHRVNILGIA